MVGNHLALLVVAWFVWSYMMVGQGRAFVKENPELVQGALKAAAV